MKLNSIVKVCSILDKNGFVKESDNLFNKIAQYYPQISITQIPNVSLVEYDEVEDEYKNNDYWRQKINPRKRVPEYRDLGGEEDGQNI
jgi:hypothetical protein